MTNLYPDTHCRSCGLTHTLYHRNDDNRPGGSAFSYVCAVSGVVVVFHPTKTPEPVILAPADAVPMTRVSD